MTSARARPPSARGLSVRLFLAMVATQEMLTIYLGVRLGIYESLAKGGAQDPAELAAASGLDERYLREWLEQQATAGFLEVEPSPDDAVARRFRLSEEHRQVLTVNSSPMSMVSLTALPLGGVAGALPALIEAFRTGDGVPDDRFGDDWRNGHSGANRALFETVLPGWLSRRLPDVTGRLRTPGAAVADVCCGAGWAGLALARAFPTLLVDGFDVDAASIEAAAGHAAAAGLTERVQFRTRDMAVPVEPGRRYDLVLLLDSLHEIPEPERVLRSCAELLADGGTLLLLDARVAPSFAAPGDEIERFQYATSVLHCLPAGRRDAATYATGTALRPAAVAELARLAGFGRCAELPFDDRFHRAYRLES